MEGSQEERENHVFHHTPGTHSKVEESCGSQCCVMMKSVMTDFVTHITKHFAKFQLIHLLSTVGDQLRLLFLLAINLDRFGMPAIPFINYKPGRKTRAAIKSPFS